MEDFGHWTLLCESQEDFYGFIYIITNTTNKRKYIGKKQCKTIVKYPPLKGKKNKRHIQKETDWRSYSGSSDWLNSDIQSEGLEKFTFEIIKFCHSKFEMAYYEAKEQFDHDVLLDKDYYNGIINLRIGRAPAKLLLEFEKK
tara:strand:- start:439 stop:864 length:426 start_codon:yes stop_codon:yes gene_type:complete